MTDTANQPDPNTNPQGQPPAQQQPPVQQPAPPQPDLLQQAPPTANEPNVVEYEPTGDVSLDIALGFFGRQGLGLDSPELAEAAKGNFAYLEAKLDLNATQKPCLAAQMARQCSKRCLLRKI